MRFYRTIDRTNITMLARITARNKKLINQELMELAAMVVTRAEPSMKADGANTRVTIAATMPEV